MKWKKKGHEFDHIGNAFVGVSKIYIYGAGKNGEYFASKINGLVDEICFFDMNGNTNPQKIVFGNKYNVFPVSYLYEVEKENAVVVVALKNESIEGALRIAIDAGWKDGENLFEKEKFLKYLDVFSAYSKGKLYLPIDITVSLNFNEKCTLKCVNCNASIPYIREVAVYPVEIVMSDVDLLFSRVDYIELLRIGGGETLLYPKLKEVIQYIHKYHSQQFGYIQFTTNGTVDISDELLSVFHECRTWVCVSDYRKQLPRLGERYEKLLKRLEEYKVKYDFLEEISWVDFGMNDINEKYKDTPTIWHDSCVHPCKDFRNGRLYSCSQGYYALRRYPQLQRDGDYLDLQEERDKKVILEYLHGYSENGFLLPCMICNGHMNLNSKYIDAAEQIRK